MQLDIRSGGTIGTFVKTGNPQIVEILKISGLDYVILDAEHAPFDRGVLDGLLLTANALDFPALVRVPDHRDSSVLSALDMGANGIVVPHVDTADQAADIVGAARFINGRRGISLSARYGRYGTRDRKEAIAESDKCLVICQIESQQALDNVEAIAAVPGVGGMMIGRSDLALSLGVESAKHTRVLSATETIIATARRNSLPSILVCGGPAEVDELASFGATSLVVGSDQSLLRTAAANLLRLRSVPLQ